MQVISENCKQLKKIRVDQDTSPYMTNHVTQKGMISICEGCRELDFLVMYLTDVNNAALAAVGQYLPKLSDFRIVLLEVIHAPSVITFDDLQPNFALLDRAVSDCSLSELQPEPIRFK